jgi:hypothetical protein
LDNVPRLPSEGQFAAVEVVLVVPDTVVVVNWHGCQFTAVFVVVPPVTVAVRVVDCPIIMVAVPVPVVPTEELIATVTWLVALLLPPPHPVSERLAIAMVSAIPLRRLLDFITLVSPT